MGWRSISVFGKRKSYKSNGIGYQSIIEQANKSLNLTSPALRGERRSGAMKRAPQVSSSPLGVFQLAHLLIRGNMTEQRIYEVVFIKTTVAALWNALTNPDVTQQYWYNTRIESEWKIGSKVLYLRNGKVTDEQVVLAVEKPHRLSHTFHPLFGEFKAEPPSRVTFSVEENGGVVRLTVVHDTFPPESKVFRACSDGWPMILNNLKTLLETGQSLPVCSFPPQTDRFQ